MTSLHCGRFRTPDQGKRKNSGSGSSTAFELTCRDTRPYRSQCVVGWDGGSLSH